jgi:dienelactone hydrolase
VRAFSRYFLLRIALSLAALSGAACGLRDARSAAEAPVSLALTTTDGATLSATFYPAEGQPSCGVVLVHDIGGSSAEWEAYAKRLQQSGIASIAFDMRGHGGSTGPGGKKVSFRSFEAQDWLEAIYDIEAARDALPEQGVDPRNLGIVGAGMGANIATHYAAQDESIQALVLISPGLEYDGVTIRNAFEAYRLRPSLLVSTKGDTYAASSAQELKENASTFCELREYPGGGHGMDIIRSLVGAREAITYWLEFILKESAEEESAGTVNG